MPLAAAAAATREPNPHWYLTHTHTLTIHGMNAGEAKTHAETQTRNHYHTDGYPNPTITTKVVGFDGDNHTINVTVTAQFDTEQELHNYAQHFNLHNTETTPPEPRQPWMR